MPITFDGKDGKPRFIAPLEVVPVRAPKKRRRRFNFDVFVLWLGIVVSIVGGGMIAAIILTVFGGCTTEDAFEGATGETPAEFIERQCKEQQVTCARVYAFTQPADNPLGRVELCVRAEDLALAESIYGGPAELSPDPRFDQWKLLGVEPVCWWQCPISMRGCNAYGDPARDIKSCFCPEVAP